MKNTASKNVKPTTRKNIGLSGTIALGICLILCNIAFAQDMQTITLNTGYNHTTNSVYPAGNYDLFWTLLSAPTYAGTTPRSANILTPYGGWMPAVSGTQWISYNNSGSSGGGDFVYQKCFCLKRGFNNQNAVAQSILNIGVRADDNFYVGLNTIPIPTNPATYFLTTSPGMGTFSGSLKTGTLSSTALTSQLRVGQNCLNVLVRDSFQVATGINLAGTLTLSGIDEVRKNIRVTPTLFKPNGYSNCSSCRPVIWIDRNSGYTYTSGADIRVNVLKAVGVGPESPVATGSTVDEIGGIYELLAININSVQQMAAILQAGTAEEMVNIALTDFPDSLPEVESENIPSSTFLLIRVVGGRLQAITEDGSLEPNEIIDSVKKGVIAGSLLTTTGLSETNSSEK
jgi:hypothetical protein